MRAWFEEISLIHGWLHITLTLGAMATLVGLLLLHRNRPWWTRRVPVALVLTGLLVAGVWIYLDVAKPWPDPLEPAVWGWIAAGLLGLVLAVAGWGRQRWWTRVLAVAGALVVVVGAADGVDTVFGSYPTIGAAFQLGVYDQVSAESVLGMAAAATPLDGPLWQAWQPPPIMPPHGAVAQVDIPATRSGFPARPAWIYLPPAYLTAAPPPMPVLMLIGGQPGGPRDWLDAGRVAQRMDAFAAEHHGLAPVVVMPDATGGPVANPLCTDSQLGRADTYLATDVVDWVGTHLNVTTDHSQWAVGGFSYGGTCALQLAVAHPDLFPTFLDASGQQGPTLGDNARTIDRAFGGDAAAFAAVDPLQEMAQRSYPSTAGFLVVGQEDSHYLPQQRAVVDAARQAGMGITAEEIPGRHNWSVWGQALQDGLPWLAGRMGLVP